MLLNDRDIDLFVASKIGSFKHIKYHTDSTKNTKKCIENLQDIKTLEKDDTITCMAWGNVEQTEILIGRKNQQVQIYDTPQAGFVKTVTADFGEGEVIGVAKYKRRLITALSGGVVKIWSKKKEKEVILETGGKLDRLRICSDDSTVFGTGGNENELKVWRVGENEPIFQAKNVAHDWLELRQPVWVSDLCFLPGNEGKLVATCSRHGFIRLYDTRAQRRPVCNVEFKAMAATCMTHSYDDRTILVGFGRGQLHQVDLRSKGRPDKGFKGNVGAVTDVTLTQDPKLVISVSLDRHVKVHDYSTKQLLYKQYLTSKLTAVLAQTATRTPLQNPEDPEVKDEEVEVKSEDDLDEIFDNLPTVSEKRIKKRSEEVSKTPNKRIVEESPEIQEDEGEEAPEDAIVKLLKSTERKKRKLEKKKKEKKAKSVFHNA